MSDAVLFKQHRQLGVITLNRSIALNALTLAMLKVIYTQLKAWENNDTVAAVLIEAEGERAFCAGGDVRWLYANRDDLNMQMSFFAEIYQLNTLIQQYKKPYIAIMNGLTMGGGVGVSLHGSYPIATERFVFSMPETAIGFFPDVGASYLLTRCPGSIGMYLGLTGARFNAYEAYASRLVKGVITSEKVALLKDALINLNLFKNPKQQVGDCLAKFLTKPDALHGSPSIPFNLIIDWFKQPSVAEILIALDQSSEALAHTIKADLLTKSPMSLAVTFQQLMQAKSKSFHECITMDYCLAKHFMQAADFYEGVRALLVDKDNMPQWQPATLTQINADTVAHYFQLDA